MLRPALRFSKAGLFLSGPRQRSPVPLPGTMTPNNVPLDNVFRDNDVRLRCAVGWGTALSKTFSPQFLQISNSHLTSARVTGIINNRTRRYLSWIEDLTTNQGVIGSNPIRRTTQIKRLLREPLFCCLDTKMPPQYKKGGHPARHKDSTQQAESAGPPHHPYPYSHRESPAHHRGP